MAGKLLLLQVSQPSFTEITDLLSGHRSRIIQGFGLSVTSPPGEMSTAEMQIGGIMLYTKGNNFIQLHKIVRYDFHPA